MAKIMAKINKRGLPLKFTANHLFPSEWPKTDRDGQHRTPPRHSPQWKAIVDYRESESWESGDLQMFADYFRVHYSSLSEKNNRNSYSTQHLFEQKSACKHTRTPQTK